MTGVQTCALPICAVERQMDDEAVRDLGLAESGTEAKRHGRSQFLDGLCLHFMSCYLELMLLYFLRIRMEFKVSMCLRHALRFRENVFAAR